MLRKFKCDECDEVREYLKGKEPEVCESCGKGKLDDPFILNCGVGMIDVQGGYDYIYGKKAGAYGNKGPIAEAEAIKNVIEGRSPY